MCFVPLISQRILYVYLNSNLDSSFMFCSWIMVCKYDKAKWIIFFFESLTEINKGLKFIFLYLLQIGYNNKAYNENEKFQL